MCKYILITAAKNEENDISRLIEAVVAQTILPERWVIVSDGSTDKTNEYVNKYTEIYGFINLIEINENTKADYASKVNAINIGYSRIESIECDFIGNLDADISFAPDYFETLISRFKKDVCLGIAGGIICELNKGKFHELKYNMNSVAGAVQLFRRRCYEEIGGYLPLERGGEDAIAETKARMHGWNVRTFADIKAYHHRRIGMLTGSILSTRLSYGIRDYAIGTHPLFMVAKCIDRLREEPYVLGSMLMMCGYLYAWLSRKEIIVSDKIKKYLRKEQIDRIKSAFSLR